MFNPPLRTFDSLRNDPLHNDAPHDVYAKHLISKTGYPLWTPEPNLELPDSYKEEGFKIGDVGLIDPNNGSFDVLFNICLPPTHELHSEGVPENFTPIILGQADIASFPTAELPRFVKPSPSVLVTVPIFPSNSDQGVSLCVDYQFSLPPGERQGAVLILPEGADRYDLRNEQKFLDEAIQHAVDWYKFAESRRIMRHASLYLITGFHKARSWSLATFHNSMGLQEYSVKFRETAIGEGGVSAAYTWGPLHGLYPRIGPAQYNGRSNQTVIVRGFRIMVNQELLHWKRVTIKNQQETIASKLVGFGSDFANFLLGESETEEVAGTHPQHTGSSKDSALSYSSSSESESDEELDEPERITIHRIPPISPVFHPSDLINQYLLTKVPSATVAVTHDNQWIQLLEKAILGPRDLTRRDRLDTTLSKHYTVSSRDDAVYLQNKINRPLKPGTPTTEPNSPVSPTTDPVSPVSPTTISAPSTSKQPALHTTTTMLVLDPTKPRAVNPIVKPQPSTKLTLLSPSWERQVEEHFTTSFWELFDDYTMPQRFIDTSNMKLIERNAVSKVFLPEIETIRGATLLQRMGHDPEDSHLEFDTDSPSWKAAIMEILQEVVRYATFSGSWTGSQPSYVDLSTGSLEGRQTSLEALAQVCDQARALGYKFIWSNRYCVNKENMQEYSVAVRRMFHWYAHSHLCIVHLSESSSPSDFGRESWFVDSWTLLALLGPRRIKFYTNEWKPFTGLDVGNDKDNDNIMSAVSATTGIPKDAIVADNRGGVKRHGVWQIMSWASRRKTSRIEDITYPLFSFFDAYIWNIRGEVKKAFPQLVKGIVEGYPSQTWDILAWAGQPFNNHPGLPSSLACYAHFDEKMIFEDVGMIHLTMVPAGLSLTSVPLIPVQLNSASENQTRDTYVITLKQQPSSSLGTYGDVKVECDQQSLRDISESTDLHICILGFHLVEQSGFGGLRIGREYVCLLLHHEDHAGRKRPSWIKVTTNNVLRVFCQGTPAAQEDSMDTLDIEGLFGLPLQTTYIRTPNGPPWPDVEDLSNILWSI